MDYRNRKLKPAKTPELLEKWKRIAANRVILLVKLVKIRFV